MKWLTWSSGYSTHLLFGLLILVLMTTVSAGAPAYWLTRTQLEAQMWSQVNATHQATLSLFQAKKDQLKETTFLLSERLTLQGMLAEKAWPELQDYLKAFLAQDKVDILLLCAQGQTLQVGVADPIPCLPTPLVRFDFVEARPVLLVSQAVYEQSSAQPAGVVVAGLWLDDRFLRQLAANTGGQQSLLRPDGTRLASSFNPGIWTGLPPSLLFTSRGEFETPGGRYYATYFPLTGSDDQMSLISEVALPVEDLIATEQRALTVLVASTGLVALIGVTLGTLYIRRLTAPLHKLTQASEKISQGNFLTQIPQLAGPTEVTTLATALGQSQAAMLKALAEQSQIREWLNTLLQSIVEGVVIFDHQERITFFTQGAEILSGWAADEALGQSLDRVFPLAEANGERFLNRLPPVGARQLIEVVTRSGKQVVLAVTGAKLPPSDNHSLQMALVLRDVTEAEAQRHLRSYFLANISHEFRTPLSTLNASLELLLDEADELAPAEIRELLKPSHLSLLSLQTLIDNLLESSRIEAGYFTLRRQPVDLNRVLLEALHIVRPLLERRQQTLTLSEPDYFPKIQGDPPRLIQVLVNLLINASKYSPLGRSIDLQVAQICQMLRVSILDQGPGISPIERLNLFRRFVRLDNHQDEQYGIGLGLYIVKTTIEAHGGQVGVEERAGGGSIFWFELPLTGEAGEL